MAGATIGRLRQSCPMLSLLRHIYRGVHSRDPYRLLQDWLLLCRCIRLPLLQIRQNRCYHRSVLVHKRLLRSILVLWIRQLVLFFTGVCIKVLVHHYTGNDDDYCYYSADDCFLFLMKKASDCVSASSTFKASFVFFVLPFYIIFCYYSYLSISTRKSKFL